MRVWWRTSDLAKVGGPLSVVTVCTSMLCVKIRLIEGDPFQLWATWIRQRRDFWNCSVIGGSAKTCAWSRPTRHMLLLWRPNKATQVILIILKEKERPEKITKKVRWRLCGSCWRVCSRLCSRPCRRLCGPACWDYMEWVQACACSLSPALRLPGRFRAQPASVRKMGYKWNQIRKWFWDRLFTLYHSNTV